MKEEFEIPLPSSCLLDMGISISGMNNKTFDY